MEPIFITILFVFIAAIAIVIAWFVWRASKTESVSHVKTQKERDDWRQQYESEHAAYGEAKTESAQMIERTKAADKNVQQLRTENEQLHAKKENNAARIAELENELQNTQKHADEKIVMLETAQKNMSAEFEKARQSMGEEFKNLSQNILEEKSKKFGEDSKKLFAPLQDNIKEFRQRVDVIHTEETQARTSLKSEIENLQKNAEKVGKDADNLARVLKGDSKTQGDWGEIVLEKLLQESGLREGQEYKTQLASRNEDGDLLKPDVVILLPDNKQLIVDSKVSLRAYNDFVNAENAEQQNIALERHVKATEAHVTNLSKKHYADAKNINAPDFVFIFMPIEPAFFAALNKNPNLFSYAYNKKIILCAPTTIMATLRTVERLWRIEAQNCNAKEIADRGTVLYKKFNLFVENMKKIDTGLKSVQKTYDNAYKQLSDGRGNLIGQAEKLHNLVTHTQQPKLDAPDSYDEN